MSRWRRSRGPLLLVALLVVVPVALVLLTSTRTTDRALDPASAAPGGARALARVLADQGVPVQREERVDDALQDLAASRSGAGAGSPSVTLVVTDADVLAPSRLRALVAAAPRVVLLGPGAAALRAAAPSLRVGESSGAGPDTPDDGVSAAAGCSDPDARAAGRASAGGPALRRSTRAAPATETTVCFAGSYAVARTPARTVVVLAQPAVVSNGDLARHGNAALALRALGQAPRVVWLVASPLDAAPDAAGSPLALLPPWVGAVSVQLALVAVAAVAWRVRRLGPLVTEPLPVVVRATETAVGRAALYRAAGSPTASAAALRAGARWRLAELLGLPPGAPAAAVAERAAQRLRAGGDRGGDAGDGAAPRTDPVRLLLGPPPGDDAGLVALAAHLDRLEAAVRAGGAGATGAARSTTPTSPTPHPTRTPSGSSS